MKNNTVKVNFSNINHKNYKNLNFSIQNIEKRIANGATLREFKGGNPFFALSQKRKDESEQIWFLEHSEELSRLQLAQIIS